MRKEKGARKSTSQVADAEHAGHGFQNVGEICFEGGVCNVELDAAWEIEVRESNSRVESVSYCRLSRPAQLDSGSPSGVFGFFNLCGLPVRPFTIFQD